MKTLDVGFYLYKLMEIGSHSDESVERAEEIRLKMVEADNWTSTIFKQKKLSGYMKPFHPSESSSRPKRTYKFPALDGVYDVEYPYADLVDEAGVFMSEEHLTQITAPIEEAEESPQPVRPSEEEASDSFKRGREPELRDWWDEEESKRVKIKDEGQDRPIEEPI
jgi:hypothetical protein